MEDSHHEQGWEKPPAPIPERELVRTRAIARAQSSPSVGGFCGISHRFVMTINYSPRAFVSIRQPWFAIQESEGGEDRIDSGLGLTNTAHARTQPAHILLRRPVRGVEEGVVQSTVYPQITRARPLRAQIWWSAIAYVLNRLVAGLSKGLRACILYGDENCSVSEAAGWTSHRGVARRSDVMRDSGFARLPSKLCSPPGV